VKRCAITVRPPGAFAGSMSVCMTVQRFFAAQ